MCHIRSAVFILQAELGDVSLVIVTVENLDASCRLVRLQVSLLQDYDKACPLEALHLLARYLRAHLLQRRVHLVGAAAPFTFSIGRSLTSELFLLILTFLFVFRNILLTFLMVERVTVGVVFWKTFVSIRMRLSRTRPQRMMLSLEKLKTISLKRSPLLLTFMFAKRSVPHTAITPLCIPFL